MDAARVPITFVQQTHHLRDGLPVGHIERFITNQGEIIDEFADLAREFLQLSSVGRRFLVYYIIFQ